MVTMLLTGLHVCNVINFYLAHGKLFTIKKKKNEKRVRITYIEKFPFVVKIGKIRVNYNWLINLLQEGRIGAITRFRVIGFYVSRIRSF